MQKYKNCVQANTKLLMTSKNYIKYSKYIKKLAETCSKH